MFICRKCVAMKMTAYLLSYFKIYFLCCCKWSLGYKGPKGGRALLIQNTKSLLSMIGSIEICLSTAYSYKVTRKTIWHMHRVHIIRQSFLKNSMERTHPKNSQPNQLHAQDTWDKIRPLSMPITTQNMPPDCTHARTRTHTQTVPPCLESHNLPPDCRHPHARTHTHTRPLSGISRLSFDSICSLVVLPSPVAPSVFSFFCFWPSLLHTLNCYSRYRLFLYVPCF